MSGVHCSRTTSSHPPGNDNGDISINKEEMEMRSTVGIHVPLVFAILPAGRSYGFDTTSGRITVAPAEWFAPS